MGPAGAVGLDFPAILSFADVTGQNTELLAEALPEVEATLLKVIREKQS